MIRTRGFEFDGERRTPRLSMPQKSSAVLPDTRTCLRPSLYDRARPGWSATRLSKGLAEQEQKSSLVTELQHISPFNNTTPYLSLFKMRKNGCVSTLDMNVCTRLARTRGSAQSCSRFATVLSCFFVICAAGGVTQPKTHIRTHRYIDMQTHTMWTSF